MQQRLATLSLLSIAMLAAVIAEAQSHSSHVWSFQNIYAIVDTGSDSTHRIDGRQRCSVGGETRNASTYESHQYQFIWFSYNKYSSTHHQYKRDDRCSSCAHVKHTIQLKPHQCESIYDTQCGQCGYTNARMCG